VNSAVALPLIFEASFQLAGQVGEPVGTVEGALVAALGGFGDDCVHLFPLLSCPP
jgi:hypothetical protein